MSTALDSIIAGVLEDLQFRKTQEPQIQNQVKHALPPKAVEEFFVPSEINVIAEIKRSSPSKGVLAEISDPVALAENYQKGGASAISVLTESRRFKGTIEDFLVVRKNIDIPMLRKDFIVDEYQVYESRVIGADLQLLIVAALDKSRLRDFFQLGTELGMTSLFEVHTMAELEIAMDLNPKMVGVNCRNLKTLELNFSVFSQIIPQIPQEIIKVAESGISTRSEVSELEKLGANAILVGETLVKSGNPLKAIGELRGR